MQSLTSPVKRHYNYIPKPQRGEHRRSSTGLRKNNHCRVENPLQYIDSNSKQRSTARLWRQDLVINNSVFHICMPVSSLLPATLKGEKTRIADRPFESDSACGDICAVERIRHAILPTILGSNSQRRCRGGQSNPRTGRLKHRV